MGRGYFRGAMGVAVAMAVATWVVAAVYDLPVRDPDGVSVPTWVRLPLIVLAAVLVDLVPRWVTRAVATPRPGVWRALRTVVSDRWTREQVWFTVSGLAAWYVAYVAFRNLKGYLPFVNERLWDTELVRLDRLMWLGHDPAVVLHEVLGTGWAAWVLSGVYVLWIGLVPAALVRERERSQLALAALSPLGERVVAERSAHFPQLSEPELVIDTLKRLLARIPR